MSKKDRAKSIPTTTVAIAGITLLDIVAAQATPPPPLPVAVQIYNWSGFYIGGTVSAASQNYSYGGPGLLGSNSTGVAGGGVFGGYNQRWGHWVFGVEAGGDFFSTGDSATIAGTTFTTSTPWTFYVRPQAGYLFTPADLGYFGIGPAWGDTKIAFPLVSQSDTGVGLNLAVGWQHKLTSLLSFRAEYDYYHFNGLHPFPDAPTSLDEHVLKAGLTYRFDSQPTFVR